MSLTDAYNECLSAMYGLRRFGIKLELTTIQNILNHLGNPQERFSVIHVAGTNGKGSVTSTLSTILYKAGYKTGLYTSPHLVRFNERICINNQPISDEAVVECCEAVKSAPAGEREPTFFEYTTAMAFYEFARQNVEWAVIETGMGGRMDATNIVKPAVSIITNISLEHQQYLGNTLVQIAGEKGGIIKDHTPVVTGVKQPSVIAALKAIAESRSAPFYRLGDHFKVRRSKSGAFTYYGIHHTWKGLTTGLSGSWQVDNAALVLAACELLNQNRDVVSESCIKNGIAQNRWPGRLEVVSTSPYIIMDGAHNLSSCRYLAGFLSADLSDRPITMVIGILDDKNYTPMLQTLLPICQRVILTRAKTDRALPPEKLESIATQIHPNVTVIPEVAQAVAYAIKTASARDAVCIAGSLYVVGEAKEFFEKQGICSFQLTR